MTDKQMIIDGVDVSECEYYGSQNNCIVYGNQGCNKFSNCYYKQLNQLEAENNGLTDELDKLKVELKDMTLKKIDYLEKSLIYEQALTEIKEIAERCYDPVDKENDGFWSILQIISEVEDDRQN